MEINGTICGTRDELLEVESLFLLEQVRKLLIPLNPFYFILFSVLVFQVFWGGVGFWFGDGFGWVFFPEKGINFDKTFFIL